MLILCVPNWILKQYIVSNGWKKQIFPGWQYYVRVRIFKLKLATFNKNASANASSILPWNFPRFFSMSHSTVFLCIIGIWLMDIFLIHFINLIINFFHSSHFLLAHLSLKIGLRTRFFASFSLQTFLPLFLQHCRYILQNISVQKTANQLSITSRFTSN